MKREGNFNIQATPALYQVTVLVIEDDDTRFSLKYISVKPVFL